MTTRGLYIAAYDVSDRKRLRQVHQVVKGYATGGQKSVFECFLTPRERSTLAADACSIMAPDEDRFMLLRIEERTQPVLLGIAAPAADPEFYYVG